MSSVVDLILGLPAWLVLTLVTVMPALEASMFLGLVFPGEVAILVGGVVAHAGGLPLWAVIAAAVVGATAGDQVGYLLGRRYGHALLDRLPAGFVGAASLRSLESRLGLGSEALTAAVLLILVVFAVRRHRARRPRPTSA